MIRKIMILLKAVFRKVCLGEMRKGSSRLGCWLRLVESVVEKVAVVHYT